MIKKIILGSFLALTPIFFFAEIASATPIEKMPAGTYTLDKNHASLVWKVSHMGLSKYTARFTKLDAEIELNPKNPAKSKLIATVDPTSIKTDHNDTDGKSFDEELAKGDKWFNANKFPEIKYESTKIQITGKDTGKIYGNLTFMGVTKPLTLDVKFNGAYKNKPIINTPGIGFSAVATLKRSDWGMGEYVPLIGDNVSLLIEVEFDKK